MTTRYNIRQKMFSIGDDFWIENQDGQRVFKIDGKVLRIRKTLEFEDVNGRKLAQIKERLLTVRDTMVIEDANGRDLAVIKKALISPLRERWSVDVKGGADLDVQGDFLNHEYTIKQGRKQVAEVSKKWLSLTDTYGVEIAQGQNDIVILAIAIAIDMMAHDGDEGNGRKRKER